jgi:hypothetical protein
MRRRKFSSRRRALRSYRRAGRFPAYAPPVGVAWGGGVSRGLSIPFASARLVVLADEGCDDALIAAIARMGIASVQRVRRFEEARRLCAAGEVDACLVVLPSAKPDEIPPWTADREAPGRGFVPTLLLAEAVTPHIKTCVRIRGYAAAVPVALAPRMLYRCIGALLQSARQARPPRRRVGTSRPPAPRIRGLEGLGREAASARKPRLQ